MDRTNEAINLFKEKYGKTPQELGFPVISVYEKQSAFIYAHSEEVIKAYKTQQNILRWIMTRFMWPLAIVMIIGLGALVKYQDTSHPLFSAIFAFFAAYMVFFFILFIKVKRAEKLIKLGKNVTYLNY